MSNATRFHHVAFGTRDVEATYDFYHHRLGLPLAHCENHLSGKGWFKHFFFDVGNGEMIGFFAFSGIGEAAEYHTDLSKSIGVPVWVNHVAFNVGSLAAVHAMKEHAARNGVKLLMEADHGWCHSVYFVDPNGIMVEFTTTTDAAALEQGHEEALRLLRQSPAEFTEGQRKDTSTVVKVAGDARPGKS